MEYSQYQQATLRPEPTLTLRKYPRCPACYEVGVITPNPDGLSHCPKCGAQAPLVTDRDASSIVVKTPWLTRFFYWGSDQLIRFHDWLQGPKS